MRRRVIERRLSSMRSGRSDFYTYRYLGGQGFLPNYAFPRESVSVSFYDRDDELSRDPEATSTAVRRPPSVCIL
jgi:hypothetical protein